MPRLVINALSPARVKHETRPGSYADGDGLYLMVTDTGGKFWIWRGTVQGKRRELSIGPVRLLSLAEARETARTWRNIARAGGGPRAERDKLKRKILTFEQAARKVHAEQIEPHSKSAKHSKQWLATLKTHAFPVIGSHPVHAITQADFLQVLAPIWTEKPQVARRVRQRIRTVLDWARTAGHREGVNPVEGVDNRPTASPGAHRGGEEIRGMSRASRLARRSNAEDRRVDDFAAQRLTMIRTTGARMPTKTTKGKLHNG